MKLNEAIESKYLKQEDIGDEEVVVTIQAYKKENVARDDEPPKYKIALKFKEFAKPMVCNPTNLRRIAKALQSDDLDLWKDQQVVLFVDPDVEFGGKVTGGLRIRASRKGGPTVTRRADDDFSDEDPFK